MALFLVQSSDADFFKISYLFFSFHKFYESEPLAASVTLLVVVIDDIPAVFKDEDRYAFQAFLRSWLS